MTTRESFSYIVAVMGFMWCSYWAVSAATYSEMRLKSRERLDGSHMWLNNIISFSLFFLYLSLSIKYNFSANLCIYFNVYIPSFLSLTLSLDHILQVILSKSKIIWMNRERILYIIYWISLFSISHSFNLLSRTQKTQK